MDTKVTIEVPFTANYRVEVSKKQKYSVALQVLIPGEKKEFLLSPGTFLSIQEVSILEKKSPSDKSIQSTAKEN